MDLLRNGATEEEESAEAEEVKRQEKQRFKFVIRRKSPSSQSQISGYADSPSTRLTTPVLSSSLGIPITSLLLVWAPRPNLPLRQRERQPNVRRRSSTRALLQSQLSTFKVLLRHLFSRETKRSYETSPISISIQTNTKKKQKRHSREPPRVGSNLLARLRSSRGRERRTEEEG
ncbi:hypothetical protein SCHPADRAFT_732176 [Schizopora paradoxa]|uniref:Uncharacterized protein n=1 Tax=Schizopora paradoxa TaxID=27342 RepID=A0A0H2R1N2_9AGAM|nr:hypothetical protein SCHPADRAFT_732176 [Schizopora paradoxa]